MQQSVQIYSTSQNILHTNTEVQCTTPVDTNYNTRQNNLIQLNQIRTKRFGKHSVFLKAVQTKKQKFKEDIKNYSICCYKSERYIDQI